MTVNVRQSARNLLRQKLGIEVRRVVPADLRNGACYAAPIQRQWDRNRPRAHRYQLAICAIFKNEAPYLREWIEFHRLVGVEKFFLYNNNSDDEYLPVLAPYIESGLVQIRHWRYPPPCQLAAYHDCIAYFGAQSRWFAFIDIDEYLFPTNDTALLRILADYESHPALAVHWLTFGTSRHVIKPAGLTIENFTMCAPEGSKTVKLILDPYRVEYFSTPHSAVFQDEQTAVNEHRQPVRTHISYPPSIETIRINHYWSRSVEEFIHKVQRGNAVALQEHHQLKVLIENDYTSNLRHDLTAQRFLPALRANLARNDNLLSASDHGNAILKPK
jgi:hypothetical protein